MILFLWILMINEFVFEVVYDGLGVFLVWGSGMNGKFCL